MLVERGVVGPLSSSLKAGKCWGAARDERMKLRVADASVSENDAWLGGPRVSNLTGKGTG